MCIGLFFFSDHCIKQIDSMLPWVGLVIDHRGRQNVVKTSVSHSPAARVPLLCFYHILTSSVVCEQQTYFLSSLLDLSLRKIVLPLGFADAICRRRGATTGNASAVRRLCHLRSIQLLNRRTATWNLFVT